MKTPKTKGHVVRATVVESRPPRREPLVVDDEPQDTRARDHVGGGMMLDDTEAPWSPVPLVKAREFLRKNPECRIEVIFPTVYDEDRSKKLEDLSVAETAGTITHQRMAEQMAKELGFDSYAYDDEMRAIEIEHQTLPPFILQGAPETTGLPGSRGDAGAAGLGTLPPMPEVDVRRADLSGEGKSEFRRDQRSMQAMERQVRRLRKRVRMLLQRVAESHKPQQPVVQIMPKPPRHVVVKRDSEGRVLEMQEITETRNAEGQVVQERTEIVP